MRKSKQILLIMTLFILVGCQKTDLSPAVQPPNKEITSNNDSNQMENNTKFSHQELKYIDMTMAQCDEQFGTPNSRSKEIRFESDIETEYYITLNYSGMECRFLNYERKGQEPQQRLFMMNIFMPGISPLRDIQIGDSFDSVIAKLPNENHDRIIDNGELVKILYGQRKHMHEYACVVYENDQPKRLEIDDAYWRVLVEFDNKQHTTQISLLSPAD